MQNQLARYYHEPSIEMMIGFMIGIFSYLTTVSLIGMHIANPILLAIIHSIALSRVGMISATNCTSTFQILNNLLFNKYYLADRNKIFIVIKLSSCLSAIFSGLSYGFTISLSIYYSNFLQPKYTFINLSLYLLIYNQEKILKFIFHRYQVHFASVVALYLFGIPDSHQLYNKFLQKTSPEFREQYANLIELAEEHQIHTIDYLCNIIYDIPEHPVLLQNTLYDFSSITKVKSLGPNTLENPKTRQPFYLRDLKPGISRMCQNMQTLYYEIEKINESEYQEFKSGIVFSNIPSLAKYDFTEEELVDRELQVPKDLNKIFKM